MFARLTLTVSDLEASQDFYATVLSELGIVPTGPVGEWGDFVLAQSDGEHPPTRGLHVGFVSPTRDHVHGFWEAGVDAGHRDAGEPGPRPQYAPDYYGAFLRDPDGNSAEAVHYTGMRTTGTVDHVWIRVADVDAAERAYTEAATGLRPAREKPDYLILRAGDGFSCSFVHEPGAPLTQHAGVAFAPAR